MICGNLIHKIILLNHPWNSKSNCSYKSWIHKR